MAAGFSTIFVAIGTVVYRAWQRGKTWVFLMPETPGSIGTLERVSLKNGEYKRKSAQEGVNERILIDPAFVTPTRKGPVAVIGQGTGWNLVAPNKNDKPFLYDQDERANESPAPVAEEALYKRMLVANPLLYEAAIESNDFGDFVNSKQEKDPWQVRLAGMVVLVIVLGLVSAAGTIYMISKLAG